MFTRKFYVSLVVIIIGITFIDGKTAKTEKHKIVRKRLFNVTNCSQVEFEYGGKNEFECGKTNTTEVSCFLPQSPSETDSILSLCKPKNKNTKELTDGAVSEKNNPCTVVVQHSGTFFVSMMLYFNLNGTKTRHSRKGKCPNKWQEIELFINATDVSKFVVNKKFPGTKTDGYWSIKEIKFYVNERNPKKKKQTIHQNESEDSPSKNVDQHINSQTSSEIPSEIAEGENKTVRNVDEYPDIRRDVLIVLAILLVLTIPFLGYLYYGYTSKTYPFDFKQPEHDKSRKKLPEEKCYKLEDLKAFSKSDL